MRQLARIVAVVVAVSAGCTRDKPMDPASGQPPVGGGGGMDPGAPADLGTAGTVGAASCQGKQPQPLSANWVISSGGVDRNFDVHVPVSYDPTKQTVVVLNFHGLTSNSMQEDLLAQMSAKADREGFVAVHPNGLNNSWNAGACCGTAASNMVDDIGFINAMLDKLETDLCVDKQRIFATGMSNGGFLSNRIGCELAGRIAAVAPVAGLMGMPTCTPSRPISVMHFHGTADQLVPYMGNPGMMFPSVPDDFANWAKRDGCTDMPFESFRKGDSHCSTYKACPGANEVILCTVENGGHTWPGGTPIPSLGNTTTDLSATDAMWDFFLRHPLPVQ